VSLDKISCSTIHCITFQGPLTCNMSWYIRAKSFTTVAFKLRISGENIMCHTQHIASHSRGPLPAGSDPVICLSIFLQNPLRQMCSNSSLWRKYHVPHYTAAHSRSPSPVIRLRAKSIMTNAFKLKVSGENIMCHTQHIASHSRGPVPAGSDSVICLGIFLQNPLRQMCSNSSLWRKYHVLHYSAAHSRPPSPAIRLAILVPTPLRRTRSNSKSLDKISCATIHCITFQGPLICRQ
jgi:hypothetical protein